MLSPPAHERVARAQSWIRKFHVALHVCQVDALCMFEPPPLDTSDWPLMLRVYMEWFPSRDRLSANWTWIAPRFMRRIGRFVIFAHMDLGMGCNRFVCWDGDRWCILTRRDLMGLPPDPPEWLDDHVHTLLDCLRVIR